MEWDDVHAALEARRLDLGMIKAAFYEATEISETTYRNMAKGQPVANPAKWRKIEIGVGWPAGTIERLLTDTPIGVSSPDDPTMEARLAKLESQVRELLRISAARAEAEAGKAWPQADVADGL